MGLRFCCFKNISLNNTRNYQKSDFPDYDGEELNQISGLLARDYGYNYPPEARCVLIMFYVPAPSEIIS